MERALKEVEAINVRTVGIDLGDGLFELKYFDENADYCDRESEEWIWSIGKCKSTGKIIASMDARFYQHQDYECLWLR